MKIKKIFVWAATAAVALGMGVVALPEAKQTTETASAAVETYFTDNFESYTSYGDHNGGAGTMKKKWGNEWFDGVSGSTTDFGTACTGTYIEAGVTDPKNSGNKVVKLKTTGNSFFYITPRGQDGNLMALKNYEFSFRFYFDDQSQDMKNKVNSDVAPWIAVLNRKVQPTGTSFAPLDGRFTTGTLYGIMTSVRAGIRKGVDATGSKPYIFSEINRLTRGSNSGVDAQNEDRTGAALDDKKSTLFGQWHTYRVKVLDTEIDLYMDDIHIGGYTIPSTNANKAFVQAGYMSIACCEWNGYIDDVKITSASKTQSYTVNVTKNIDAAGTVEGAGRYEEGEPCTLTATTNAGYTFDGWYLNGTKKSSSATFSGTVTADITFEARWKINQYPVTFSKNIAEAGTLKVDGDATKTSGTYNHGTKVQLEVTTNPGFTWLGWSDGVSAQSRTVEITGAQTYEAKWKSDKVTITTSQNIADAGTVSGGGEVAYGANVTLTATTKEGYKFLGWYDNTGRVSPDATYTFSATASKNVEARWEVLSYTVTLQNETPRAGSVIGAGQVNYDQSKAIKAEPNAGYQFDGWYDEKGALVSNSAAYTIKNVKADVTLVAKWIIPTHTITISGNEAAGRVAGGGTKEFGETITVTATTTNDDYYFDGWYQGTTKKTSQLTYTFTVDSDVELQAKWIKKVVLTVTKNIAAAGDATQGGKFQVGETVRLTATENDGYRFVGWYVGGEEKSTNKTFNVTLSADMAVEAKWVELFEVELAANFPAGFVNGAGIYDNGKVIMVTASISSTKYDFLGWYENYVSDQEKGTRVSTDLRYQFKVEKSVSLTAVWETNVPTYTITVEAAQVGGETAGTVAGAGSYAQEDKATLTATTNKGYNFDGWYVGGTKVSQATTYVFTVMEAKTVVAKWTVKHVTVYFDTDGAQVINSVLVQEGKAVTAPTAPTKKGYTFAGWFKGTEEWNFADAVDVNMTLKAKWNIVSFTITAQAEQVEGATAGTVAGSGSFNYGAQATLMATVNSGYLFDGWYIGTTKVSSSATFTFTVNEEKTYTAKWVKNEYVVTVTKNPAEAGDVTGNGTYAFGESATLTATTNPGYVFVGWYDGETEKSDQATYTFTVNGDTALIAKWTAQSTTEPVNKTVEVKRGEEAVVYIAPGVNIISFYNDTLAKAVDFEEVTHEIETGEIIFVESYILNLDPGEYTYTVTATTNADNITYSIKLTVSDGIELSPVSATAGTDKEVVLKAGASAYSVKKDGVEVNAKAYSVDKGKGSVTFEGAYLADLGEGDHKFTIETDRGIFIVTLKVKAAADADGAGCGNSVGLSSAVTLLGLAGAALVASKKRKKK